MPISRTHRTIDRRCVGDELLDPLSSESVTRFSGNPQGRTVEVLVVLVVVHVTMLKGWPCRQRVPATSTTAIENRR